MAPWLSDSGVGFVSYYFFQWADQNRLDLYMVGWCNFQVLSNLNGSGVVEFSENYVMTSWSAVRAFVRR